MDRRAECAVAGDRRVSPAVAQRPGSGPDATWWWRNGAVAVPPGIACRTVGPIRGTRGHDPALGRVRGGGHRYRWRVSEIPWWALPLVAAVFALAGAGVTLLVSARDEYARSRAKRTKRWYAERKEAYIALLTEFDRATYRLRAAYDGGHPPPGPFAYVDAVGPALMRVRLLASGPVRSAALAVHLLIEKLYAERQTPPPGVEPEKSVREMLGHVPLVMQQFEAAVREELGIEASPPPPPVDPPSRGLRSYIRRPSAPAPSQKSRVTG